MSRRILLILVIVGAQLTVGATITARPAQAKDQIIKVCKNSYCRWKIVHEDLVSVPHQANRPSPNGKSNLPKCGYRPLEHQPAMGSPAWEGHSPSEGFVAWSDCGDSQADSFKFIPNGTPNVPPAAPDPYLLASEAVGRLKIPNPAVHVGPDDTKVAVQLHTWLWVDDPGAQTVTVTAGRVSVTATATLNKTAWTIAEPVNPDRPAALTEPVVCDGPGRAPVEGVDNWKTVPPCGYTFHWMSLPERTADTGKWPLSVTAMWSVRWQANTGQSGAETLAASTDAALTVGQYRNILVHDGG